MPHLNRHFLDTLHDFFHWHLNMLDHFDKLDLLNGHLCV